MKKSGNKREEFIETASKLFEVKGYNATGLNEILKESNAPKGSLYYYFPKGKEQLGCEAIELAGEKIINKLKDVLSTHENIVEGLIANINEIAEIIDDEKKTRDMTISLIALETYSSSEVLRKKCEKVFIELEKIYYDAFIDIGMKSEEAAYKSSVIQSMMEGAITTSLVKKNGSSLRNIAKIIPEIIKL